VLSDVETGQSEKGQENQQVKAAVYYILVTRAAQYIKILQMYVSDLNLSTACNNLGHEQKTKKKKITCCSWLNNF